MTSLAARSRQEEQMDSLELDAATYAQVLGDLARINKWTFNARPTLSFLARATRGMRAFRLLDVGFGHGDMLRAIARWAAARGIEAELIGVDINPRSAPIARAATPADWGIDYRTGDYFDQPGPFDFVISSLVTHHMTDTQLLRFIADMEARTRRGWLVNDLRRHWFAYRGFPLLARLTGVHRIVRQDGQLSIARSFREAEWRAILDRAGIEPGSVEVVRRFPFRLCVERVKDGG